MPFDYHEPQTLSEAFRLLASEGEAGAILAGGTDLLLQMRRRVRSYRSVINIKAIPGLNELRYDPAEGLTCGALVTFRELETDPAVRLHYPALSEAAALVAGVQLRNLATVGGNVGNASPAADSIPPLVALGATSEIAGPGGSRNVSLDECFVGPGKTILAADELFTVFHIPPPPANSGNVYPRPHATVGDGHCGGQRRRHRPVGRQQAGHRLPSSCWGRLRRCLCGPRARRRCCEAMPPLRRC